MVKKAGIYWLYMAVAASFGCATMETPKTGHSDARHWQPFELPGGFPSRFVIIHGFSAGQKDVVKEVASGKNVGLGQKVYEENCKVCHGVHGEGDGEFARKLEKKPANLRLVSDWKDFFIKVSKGSGQMPAWQDKLSREEMVALIKYLKKWQ